MKQVLIVIFILFIGFNLQAQTDGVSINQTGNGPDSSAILDVQSTDKGILIPRMTSSQRSLINLPATGLLVYDLDTESFWFYEGSTWVEITQENGTIQGPVGNIQAAYDGIPIGNQRGHSSVDLQFTRFNATQIASGNWSVIGGGRYHTASGASSTISGGVQNIASNEGAFIGGGYTNIASGVASSIGGGNSNIASGIYATIPGGSGLEAESYAETVLGIFNEASGGSSFSWIGTDPILTVGNGSSNNSRSNAMTILKNGNTGLGTNIPDTKLHLVGQLKYEDGNQAIGKVLTSDADGIATWQTFEHNIVSDNDNDTKIQVEESADEDIIRMDIAGDQIVKIDSNGFYARNLFANAVYDATSFLAVNYHKIGQYYSAWLLTSPSWQSFKATSNGKIDYIELLMHWNPSATITISIYAVLGPSLEFLFSLG